MLVAKKEYDNSDFFKQIILKELERNQNRAIIDQITELGGITNSGIDINISRQELINKLRGCTDNKILRKVLK